MKKNNNNILFLLHLPPAVHGVSMVGELIKSSKIINDTFDARYINLLVSRSIDETGKTKVLKLWRFLVSWFKLLFELTKSKPTLCYFALSNSGSAFYKDVTLVFLLRFFKVKTVFHIHSKNIKKNESKKIYYLLYKYVFKKSSVIILSKYLYDDVKTFVSMEQLYICPNGVEDTMKKNEAKIEKKTGPIKILFLSNLIIQKGVFVLIEACEILRNKGYTFSCDFVGGEGDVSVKQFRNEVEKRGLSETVKYLGKKYGKDKNTVYKSADVFVLPTSNDCFPLVLLEAMQYGLPVISTIEGGIPDIVDNNITGFMVEQDNPNDLADKLEILINNYALRKQMGNAGRKKYEKEFTLQAFEEKLLGILQELLLKEKE